jgi:hypothetical protein
MKRFTENGGSGGPWHWRPIKVFSTLPDFSPSFFTLAAVGKEK